MDAFHFFFPYLCPDDKGNCGSVKASNTPEFYDKPTCPSRVSNVEPTNYETSPIPPSIITPNNAKPHEEIKEFTKPSCPYLAANRNPSTIIHEVTFNQPRKPSCPKEAVKPNPSTIIHEVTTQPKKPSSSTSCPKEITNQPNKPSCPTKPTPSSCCKKKSDEKTYFSEGVATKDCAPTGRCQRDAKPFDVSLTSTESAQIRRSTSCCKKPDEKPLSDGAPISRCKSDAKPLDVSLTSTKGAQIRRSASCCKKPDEKPLSEYGAQIGRCKRDVKPFDVSATKPTSSTSCCKKSDGKPRSESVSTKDGPQSSRCKRDVNIESVTQKEGVETRQCCESSDVTPKEGTQTCRSSKDGVQTSGSSAYCKKSDVKPLNSSCDIAKETTLTSRPACRKKSPNSCVKSSPTSKEVEKTSCQSTSCIKSAVIPLDESGKPSCHKHSNVKPDFVIGRAPKEFPPPKELGKSSQSPCSKQSNVTNKEVVRTNQSSCSRQLNVKNVRESSTPGSTSCCKQSNMKPSIENPSPKPSQPSCSKISNVKPSSENPQPRNVDQTSKSSCNKTLHVINSSEDPSTQKHATNMKCQTSKPSKPSCCKKTDVETPNENPIGKPSQPSCSNKSNNYNPPIINYGNISDSSLENDQLNVKPPNNEGMLEGEHPHLGNMEEPQNQGGDSSYMEPPYKTTNTTGSPYQTLDTLKPLSYEVLSNMKLPYQTYISKSLYDEVLSNKKQQFHTNYMMTPPIHALASIVKHPYETSDMAKLMSIVKNTNVSMPSQSCCKIGKPQEVLSAHLSKLVKSHEPTNEYLSSSVTPNIPGCELKGGNTNSSNDTSHQPTTSTAKNTKFSFYPLWDFPEVI